MNDIKPDRFGIKERVEGQRWSISLEYRRRGQGPGISGRIGKEKHRA